MPDVRLYIDFVSPYSWLALREAEAFAEQNALRWDLRPVVYAKLLDATGLVGPAEVELKRRYTWYDVARCAKLAGLPFRGPPAHPFRSLAALRTLCLYLDEPQALKLTVALAAAAWEQGCDLTDPAVLADVVESAGLAADGLETRIADPSVKDRLRELTAGALADGVFGVPGFVHDGQVFWGHDRMPHLAAHLAGRLRGVTVPADAMARRPRGADRRPRR